MKNGCTKVFTFCLMGLMTMAIMGCPLGLDYPLDKPGTHLIDANLIGTWSTENEDAEMLKVKVSRSDSYTYAIEVLETSENFMAESTSYLGWIAELDGKRFIVARPEGEYMYFHYYFETNGKNLKIYDVGLLDGGIDAVTDIDALRNEVSRSLKLPDCLTDMISYRRE